MLGATNFALNMCRIGRYVYFVEYSITVFLIDAQRY